MSDHLKLTDHTWQLEAESEAEKRSLLDYAAAHGIPYNQTCYEDDDLWLSFYLEQEELWANPHQDPEKGSITADQFRALCDAYAG